jgi:hypothetical protein
MANIYNETGIIGVVIEGLTTDVTGSLFLTLLMLTTMIVIVMLMFRIPVEYHALIIAPLMLTLMAYTQEFMAIGGIMLIIMAIVFAKVIAL